MNSKPGINQYGYIVFDKEVTLEDYRTFDSRFDKDEIIYLAEAAAEDYYSINKGWKDNYSISIEVYAPYGEQLGIFNVKYELSPYFIIENINLN